MKILKWGAAGFVLAGLVVGGFILGQKFNKDSRFPENYECAGSVNTMFMEFPLWVKINGDDLSLDWDLSEIRRLVGELIPIPDIKSTYRVGVQYSDGVLVERVNGNTLEISHHHVTGTLLLDRCELEYPIEIDSLKSMLGFLSIFSL